MRTFVCLFVEMRSGVSHCVGLSVPFAGLGCLCFDLMRFWHSPFLIYCCVCSVIEWVCNVAERVRFGDRGAGLGSRRVF